MLARREAASARSRAASSSPAARSTRGREQPQPVPHVRPGAAGLVGGVEDDEVLARDQPGPAQVDTRREPGLATADHDDRDVGPARRDVAAARARRCSVDLAAAFEQDGVAPRPVELGDAGAYGESPVAGGWCSARLARFSGKIEVCSVHSPARSASITWVWSSDLPTPRPRAPRHVDRGLADSGIALAAETGVTPVQPTTSPSSSATHARPGSQRGAARPALGTRLEGRVASGEALGVDRQHRAMSSSVTGRVVTSAGRSSGQHGGEARACP